MNLNLLITAVTPGIGLSLLIYFYDRHDREPVKMLLKVFIMGCFSVIPTLIVETILSSFNIFTGILGAAYTAFIVAGLTEEYFKRRVVLKTVFLNPVFNEKLDGIVYCILSALGFATIENIMYVVFRFSDVETIGLFRAVLSVPAHMLFATTMGYYISLSKFSKTNEESDRYLRKSLTMPIVLHGIYDFILLSGNDILMLFFMPFIIYLWVSNLKKLNKYYDYSSKGE